MGSRIQCFLIEPTARTERTLRRFTLGENKCSGKYGYHNASTPFGEGKCHMDTTDTGYKVWKWDDEVEEPPHDDPRWPRTCDCSYLFQPEDTFQVFREVIYVRMDTGVEMTLRNCPPGAMWDADWYPEKGSDGKALCVALPPGGGDDSWHIDGYAKGGGKWTRTGTVPNVTANPSILTPRYHGWLRDGWLVEC
jgi:hypothetical protein